MTKARVPHSAVALTTRLVGLGNRTRSSSTCVIPWAGGSDIYNYRFEMQAPSAQTSIRTDELMGG